MIATWIWISRAYVKEKYLSFPFISSASLFSTGSVRSKLAVNCLLVWILAVRLRSSGDIMDHSSEFDTKPKEQLNNF